MQLFIVTGVAVSAFFVVFILFKKNRKRTDYLLILINLLMIGFLVLDLLVRENLTTARLFFQTLIPYYLFPVFFLFSLETLQQKRNSLWLLILLPACITTIYVGFDLFLTDPYDSARLQLLYNDPPFNYHMLYKGNQIFFIVALLWLIRKLRLYGLEIKENFSFTDPIQLHWLTRFSWIYLAITFISLISFVASNLNLLPIDIKTAYAIVSASLVLAIFYISFQGIRQYSIAEYYGNRSLETIRQSSIPITKDASSTKEKYKGSTLSDKEVQIIYSRLLSLFEEKVLYLEPKLQLQDVADALGVSPHALSQTINTLAGTPFYDFVNKYRVAHLQKLLADPTKRRFTILALGMESGFNSKASLNRVFRLETGLSPSEYQKRQLQ